ncbi:hypothetical protein GQ457_08G017290 [Hibiscus cannabinus]
MHLGQNGNQAGCLSLLDQLSTADSIGPRTWPVGFPRYPPEVDENGLEATVIDGSDLSYPPLDHLGFEICRPPVPSLPSDRWDSPGNAPVTGDGVTEMVLSGGEMLVSGVSVDEDEDEDDGESREMKKGVLEVGRAWEGQLAQLAYSRESWWLTLHEAEGC